MYNVVVFLHILGAFGFVLAHGVAVFVSLALRRERSLERLRALLDLSLVSSNAMNGSLIVLFIAGIAAGFMGQWWGSGWIWTALALLLVISAVMGIFGARFYGHLRLAIGAQIPSRINLPVAEKPPTPEELDQIMARDPSILLAVVGTVGLVIIIWLMRFKPF